MPPEDAVDEFANTFKEWHYLVAGLCVGFVAGWLAAAEYLRGTLHGGN
jgi:uncharacterized membrane-anchored protein YhcB (DUF1043 family)